MNGEALAQVRGCLSITTAGVVLVAAGFRTAPPCLPGPLAGLEGAGSAAWSEERGKAAGFMILGLSA